MRLRWREFEKRVGREVKARVRRSPALRRLAGKGRTSRLKGAEDYFVRGFLLLFAASALAAGWLASAPPGHVIEARAALLELWFLGMTATSASLVRRRRYPTGTSYWLCFQPVTDRDIARHELGFLGRWTFGWLPFLAAFGLLLPVDVGWSWPAAAAGVVLVGLHYLAARALGMHAAVWGWPGVHWLAWSFLGALVLALHLENGNDLAPATWRAFEWVPVFGWLNHVYLRGFLGGDGWAWLILLPVSVVFWALPVTRRRWLEAYRLEEEVLNLEATEPEHGREPTTTEEERSDRPASSEDAQAVRAAVREALSRVEAPWWKAGWCERIARNVLTRRERTEAELILGGPLGWSGMYHWAAKRWLIAVAGVVALGLAMDWLRFVWWMPLLPLLFAVPVLVPAVTGAWGLTAWMTFAGGVVPAALFPLHQRRLYRWLVKLGLLRLALGSPFVLGTALLGAWWWPEAGTGVVLAYTVRVLGLLAASTPLLALWSLSPSTFDSTRVRLPTGLLLILMLLLMTALGLMVFLVETSTGWLAPLGFIVLVAQVAVWLQRRAWVRGRFDMGPAAPNH